MCLYIEMLVDLFLSLFFWGDLFQTLVLLRLYKKIKSMSVLPDNSHL